MANLSQKKRQRMLNFLNIIKEEHKDNDEALKAIYEIENELVSKKYGLVWEEHEENVDIQMRENIPVFTEIKDKEIVGDVNNPNFNFLLEGDNLHSLKLLEKTHKHSIDVILIDPPYNTGNTDFMYDDNYVAKDDTFKHSKWLSFMEKRLRIMYKLLKDDGMIIIHIDENEFVQLRLLCDEIFGDLNHLGDFIWKARSGKGGTNSVIATQHEYIVCYAKDCTKVNFRQDVNITQKEKSEKLRQWGQGVYREDRKTMFFPIFVKGDEFKLPTYEEFSLICVNDVFNDEYLDRLIKKYEVDGYEAILPMIDNEYGRWRKGYVGVQELIDDNLLILTVDRNDEKCIKKIIPPDKETTTAIDSIILDCGSASTGTLQIKELFNKKKVFDTTKPLEIEKFLLNLGVYNKPNAIVLDCFAGSGTTGNAVLELNKDDGGLRKFILCTNDEGNICEKVTYERIKKVIKGYEFKGKKDNILFEKNITLSDLKNSDKLMEKVLEITEQYGDDYDNVSKKVKDGRIQVIGTKVIDGFSDGFLANLKYYKTDYIPKIQDDEDTSISDDLLSHIKEMVQLEHGISIDNDKYHIILTDEDADRVEQEWENYKNCKAIYVSKNVLLTASQNKLFSSVDVKTIPDYYFENELREVGEIW